MQVDGTIYAGENVPVKFFTTTFDQHMKTTTFYMPVKVTLDSLSEFVNVSLGISEHVPFNFLYQDEFIRYTTLDRWLKKKGISKETTIELEYTPAFEIEAGNNFPHDDWVSVIRRLPIPSDASGDATQHPYLTGSYDRCWRIWRGDECLHVGAGHTSAIKSASIISASEGLLGKRKRSGVDCQFATGAKDGSVIVWQYSGGRCKEVHKFAGTESVDTVAVHGDGSLLCSGGWDKLLRIWTLDRLQEDMEKGDVGRQQYLHCGLQGHSRAILASAWSQDHRARVFSTGLDGSVRTWDVMQKAPIMTMTSDASAAYCLSVRKASGGDLLLTGHTDNKVRLWDTRSPTACTAFAGHKGFVYGVTWNALSTDAVSEKGLRFTSASEDCTLNVWDIRGGSPLATISEHSDGILCVEWMGDGVLMTGSKDNTVKSCNLKSDQRPQSSA
uniref:NLE domain-containing protein n=1 Tax=Eutreptiella gymnastica TaxID=73025 RepID=A0A7S1IPK5_9EUGL